MAIPDILKTSLMRHYGRIKKWKDDQGFGFITPNSGGKEVFVHVKAFANQKKRPVGNELVSYVLGTDTRNRINAVNVVFVSDLAANTKPTDSLPVGGSWTLVGFALLFLALLGYGTYIGKVPNIVLGLYYSASAIAFFAYGFDKAAASSNKWRTAEDTLHCFGIVGGWPGALLAQELFRHKYRKQAFRIVFWLTVTLNCGALGVFLWSPASQFFLSILNKISS